MAEIINIRDRLPKQRGDKMFTLSFYQKNGRWTVDVDEISMAYENSDIDAIMHDIHIGVSKIEQHLRNKEKK
jgi:hypothetical protein